MPMLPTRISVCTASGLSTMTTRRVEFGGSTNASRDHLARLPVAEDLLDGVEGLVGRHVADDGQDRVVRREIPLMERDQIVRA